MDTPPRTIDISPESHGQRLDVLLCEELSLSRAQIEWLLESRKVRLDGRIVTKKGVKLEAGQSIEVEAFVRPEQWSIVPDPEAPLTVLAQGPGWVVVDKPAGVPVHPLGPDERHTLLNAVAARYPQVQGVGEGGLRSGVVHRLDVETSGCVAVALEEATWSRLRRAFTEHRTEKLYRAIVGGRLRGEGREKVTLQVTQHKPARVRVVESAPGLWRCDLAWRAVESFRDATLLEVKLGTGFLHQIRATLSHMGHPIVGDVLYGAPARTFRVMLHAASLAVEDVRAASADPADFAAMLEHLRTA